MEDASAPTSALGRLRQAAEDGRLAEVALQHGLDLIVAFGSTMSGDVGAGDLDLAVQATHHLDPLRLLDDLARLAGPAEIDLLDLRRASIVARAQALEEGECLYEGAPGTYARAATAALVQRADTQWLRKLELDLLAER